MSTDLKTLTHAAGYALIDMELPGWGSAIETDYHKDGRIEVTFSRMPTDVPTVCTCPDDEDEDCCDFCAEGGFVESEYLEIVLKIKAAR